MSLERDLEELEATDPAVAEASARLDDTVDALLDRVRQQDAADNAEHQRVHGDCLTRQVTLIAKAAEARTERDDMREARDVVREHRDELAERLATLTKSYERLDKLAASFRESGDFARSELESARSELATRNRQLKEALAEVDRQRSELEQVRRRTHDVIGQAQWCVARDGGRSCTACGQEIRRGEAYAVNTVRDEQAHVFCPEVAA